MDRSKNRLARVHQLVEEAGSLARFAEIVGISPAQAWQIASKSPVRGIGAKTAAKIEHGFGRPPGWLDMPIGQESVGATLTHDEPWPFRLASRDEYEQLTQEEKRDLDKTIARFIAGCLTARDGGHKT